GLPGSARGQRCARPAGTAPVVRAAQVRHGGVRCRAVRLPRRAHGREPQDLLRRGVAGHLRRVAAGRRGARAAPGGAGLGRPGRAAGRRDRPHRGRDDPRAARRAGPAGQVREPPEDRGLLRRAHDALGRGDHRPVRRVPHPRPDDRHAEPQRPVRAGLRQRGGRLRAGAVVRHRLLRPGRRRGGSAPAPRPVERASVAGPHERAQPERRAGHRHHRGGRARRRLPGRSALRHLRIGGL
ncbi:MAG: Succinate dehydrogenase cytochrome b subunit, partial [uncultured Pseudonocardia sp.]